MMPDVPSADYDYVALHYGWSPVKSEFQLKRQGPSNVTARWPYNRGWSQLTGTTMYIYPGLQVDCTIYLS